MMYNIHPLLVHFPIAFLFLYSIIKIMPFQKWFPSVSWKQIERTLLLVGVLGAFASSSTGEIAEELTNPNSQLVDMHAFFASLSTWLYGLILAGEVLYFLTPFLASKLPIAPLIALFSFVQKILQNPILSKVLALLGLIAISITGMLGGVMVYGLTADPLAEILLRVLNINI